MELIAKLAGATRHGGRAHGLDCRFWNGVRDRNNPIVAPDLIIMASKYLFSREGGGSTNDQDKLRILRTEATSVSTVSAVSAVRHDTRRAVIA